MLNGTLLLVAVDYHDARNPIITQGLVLMLRYDIVDLYCVLIAIKPVVYCLLNTVIMLSYQIRNEELHLGLLVYLQPFYRCIPCAQYDLRDN